MLVSEKVVLEQTEAPKTEAAKTDAPKAPDPKATEAKTEVKTDDKAPPAAAAVVDAGKKDEPAAEAKPGDKAPVEAKDEPKAPVVPEKYELALPKDSQVRTDTVKSIEAFAKENKLTNSEAQLLINREHQETAALAVRQAAWVDEIKNDKEFGGDALPMNAEMGKRVVDTYFPELREVLIATKLGNHPDFLRGLFRLGKAMGNDVLDRGGAAVVGNESHAEVMFGKNKK